MAVDLRFDDKTLDLDNLAQTEEKIPMKELVEYYDDTTTGGKRKNKRYTRRGKGVSPKSPKSSLAPKLYKVIEEIIINKLKSLSSKEFQNINIMPLDEANIVFDTSITSNSLTRKRGKSNPKTSKQGKTLSKRSKSLSSLMKSNGAFPYNFNAINSSINLSNMNIQNKYYINIVRQRHNKISETHKKILTIMELNSKIRLKEKVTSKHKRLTGTLKNKSFNKSNSPTSVMAF